MTAPKRRLRECVERWPEAETGAYDPSCCRFPKSCSASVYDEGAVAEEDLEPVESRRSPAMPDQPIDLNAIRARYAAFDDAWDSEYMSPDGPAKAARSAEDVPALLAEVARLQARFDAAASLTHDTDGNQLHCDEDIPVGELQRALFDVAW